MLSLMAGGPLMGDSIAVLSVTLLLSLTGLHASCPLEVDPPSVVVEHNHSVRVHCWALAQNVIGMGIEATSNGTGLKETRNLTWYLESVVDWKPMAKCYISVPKANSDDVQCFQVIPITVYKFPDSVRLVDSAGSTNNFTLKEGSSHSMMCLIKAVAPAPNVTVSWYIGNSLVFTMNTSGNQTEPRDLKLKYNYYPRREHNGHNMSCRVTFNLGPSGPTQATVSQQHPLCVLYPPKTKQPMADTELQLGSSVDLRCLYESNPPLGHRWLYYKTRNVEESEEDGGVILHIHNATEVNTGKYRCLATNLLYEAQDDTTVTVTGAPSPCPIKMTPARLVMRYGELTSVTCDNSTEDAGRNLLAVSWTVGQSAIQGRRWDVAPDNDWDPRPACVANFSGIGECRKPFDVTFYKTPDIVRIRVVNGTRVDGFMLEDREYLLVCEVLNVAPVQNLTVRWFLDETPIQDQVSDCSLATADCPRSPLNKTFHLRKVLLRDHSGAQVRCEAQLTLETVSPPPTASLPLNITLYYEPVINKTSFPAKVPVFRGYPEDLVCVAEGRPSPNVSWWSNGVVRVFSGTLTVTEAGVYICNASNCVGYTTQEVEVVLKEDYLPLIAGMVAVTVLVISAIFLFFYSIYYKNTRMRHYSLKRPKLSTHNGNVAHSSWGKPLPMTKRS